MNKFLVVMIALTILSCKVSAAELNDISIMEKEILGVEYKDETAVKRLSRLEKYVFGKEKSGTNQDRINNISEAAGISFMPKQTAEEKRVAAADFTPEDSNVTYPVIDMMEQEKFKKTYQGENVYKRVERLEKTVFGKSFEGDLSDRTDKLKAAVLAVKPEKITYDDNYNPSNLNSYSKTPISSYNDDDGFAPMLTKKTNSFPTGMAAPLNQSYYNSYGNNTSDFEFALSAAENMILGKTNKDISPAERLSKLEKKVFKKTYSGDHLSRLDRIVSAAHAQKSGQVYKENKWDKYISTGIQVGTIVLMILAMIL